MAEIRLTDRELRVALSPVEKLGALHGDVVVPRDAVIAARATDSPFSDLRGIRAPGTGVPGRLALGVWRRRGGKAFAALRRGRPGLVVDLRDQPFERLLVSTPDASRLAAELAVG